VERRRRKIPGPNGEPTDAFEVGFRSAGEYWNEYLLDDGTVIRLKPVVVGVLRVEDQYDGEGQPLYAVKANNIVVISAPDELLQRGIES
jgi:hypothetical protein